MSGDRTRRTSSGRALRLVGSESQAPSKGPREESALVLPPLRKSVAVGRHWVVRVAAAAGVTGMANQVVELLTSELLANAVLHGAAGEVVGLRIECTEDAVRVSVSDSVEERPVVMHPEPVAPGGRGMAIVEAMSHRWGVDAHPDGGKTVWFELDLEQY